MSELKHLRPYAFKHLRFGWWSLLVFLTLGLTLELMHGFKLRMYLDVSNETRRLLWTLAHAHGARFGLIHIVFGLFLQTLPNMELRRLSEISTSLIAASLLLPGGFFLGGLKIYGGDPGLGILAVPAGALALIFGVYGVAREFARQNNTSRKKRNR